MEMLPRLQVAREGEAPKAAGGERGIGSPRLQATRKERLTKMASEAPQGCRRREKERLPKTAGSERGRCSPRLQALKKRRLSKAEGGERGRCSPRLHAARESEAPKAAGGR